jgi:hypothetical protein
MELSWFTGSPARSARVDVSLLLTLDADVSSPRMLRRVNDAPLGLLAAYFLNHFDLKNICVRRTWDTWCGKDETSTVLCLP